jgi:hypothetical protein
VRHGRLAKLFFFIGEDGGILGVKPRTSAIVEEEGSTTESHPSPCL